MISSVQSPLGVCLAPAPELNFLRTVRHPDYIYEILAHAGVCRQSVDPASLPNVLPQLRVLVTVGDVLLSEAAAGALRSWVDEGGAWLAVGGTCGMADVFGVEVENAAYSCWGGGASTLGEGYLDPQDRSHPMLSHLRTPLHFFNGTPVRAQDGRVLAAVLDKHQRPTPRAAVVEVQRGRGTCVLIAADITGSVVHIQQGTCVTRDGIPAPDGTSPVCDGVLKTDDGAVLDWIFDRQDVEGVPGFRAFLEPVADQLRELLLRGIFYLSQKTGAVLPVLWLYPRNLPAIGHLSHDTDLCEPDKGYSMLEVVKQAGIKSTWCTILPGYPADLINAVRDAGHELAMHFDAMSEGTVWSEHEFHDQWKALTKMFGGKKPVTNKNHYLRWEGDVEFFLWCERRGIRFDESKGASKTGEAGFNFGTCHPYFPVTPDGSIINVLELPTLTQDLEIFAPRQLAHPLLDAAYRVHGVFHLLFHPAHIQKPGVADSLLEGVRKAQELGMEWWTAHRISEWERARRQVDWSDYSIADGRASVTISGSVGMGDASIMWLGGGTVQVDGQDREARAVNRWGFDFTSVTLNLEPDTKHEISLVS